jgi:pimeloyl-ACP methyl ester carboxylesterase
VRTAGRLGLAALLVCAGLAGCAAPAATAPPENARPVLFVHGYGEPPEVFDTMIDHLVARGYPRDMLLAVTLDPADGSSVAAAEGPVAAGVEQLVGASGGTVDIVAHSMGGVSARWYASRLHPERVRSLTTVVGANHGTDVLCGLPGAGAAEMCPAFSPDGQVQAALNGAPGAPVDETPYGRGPDPAGVTPVPAQDGRTIRYTAVAIPVDEWIEPVASSDLAGADELTGLPSGLADQPEPGNLVAGFATDHDAILHDDAMLSILDTVLTAAGAP